MKRKIVAFGLILTIAIGNLYGMFTIYEDVNVVADIPGEHKPDVYTVGLWHFNESSGPKANDSSSYNNHGTLRPNYPSDSPQWVDGKFEKALEFDGVNDFVEVPDSSSLDITDEITMEAWVKPYSFSTIPYIISKKKTDTSILYALLLSSDGRAKAFFDTPNHITAWDPIPLNEWTHIAATFDGSVKRIYINGEENINETYSHTTPTSIYPVYIGRAGVGDYFDGIIDEVRLSNVGRTAGEIADYYRSTSILYVDDSYTGSEPGFGITKFKVIQNAIDNATVGNTIFVFNGTYYENVVVNKTINLTGEDRNKTIIDGGGSGDVVYMEASWVNITGFSIIGSGPSGDDSGIELNNVQNCMVKNNNISGNHRGIRLNNSSWNVITNNNASNNNYGIRVVYSNNNTITDNNCDFNTHYGITLYSSNENNVIDNNVSNNERGIELFWYSKRNNISGNNASENDYGFYIFWNSDGNYIINNMIINNVETFGYGIYVSSSNNWIYYNNIIDNKFQAYDDFGNNFWDNGYPYGGNYWSDYGGVDKFKGPNQNIPGKDDIGDTPYTNILGASGAHDNYPFMVKYRPLENYAILKQGWNLISISLIQEEKNLTRVLGSIDSWYDAVQWYDITDTNDLWKHYKVGKPNGNDLFELNETMGFWIHITQPGDTIFVYNGTQPPSNQTITLHQGWNMVGYPSLTNYNRTEGLNNITYDTHVDAILTYNAATQKYKKLGSSDYFEPGKGYYIHAKEECAWEVPL